MSTAHEGKWKSDDTTIANSNSFFLRQLYGSTFWKSKCKSPNRSCLWAILVFSMLLVCLWSSSPGKHESLWTKSFDTTLHQNHLSAINHGLECIGWVHIESCPTPNEDVESVRLTTGLHSCSTEIFRGNKGHCLLRNVETKEEVKAMNCSCDCIPESVSFSCNMAATFHTFKERADERVVVGEYDAYKAKRGILMGVHNKLISAAFASIMVLRKHGCILPIEFWFRTGEIDRGNPVIGSLVTNYGVTLREITDRSIKGYYIKPFALYHSAFEEALLLDTDNVPVRDPTYLFESPEFKSTGAIFWPDYWHPRNAFMNLVQSSLVWEYIGVEPRERMLEQESAQVLVSRKKHRKALELLRFYSSTEPNLFRDMGLAWGDKDLFRFAWMRSGSDFHYLNNPPASGGWYDSKINRFCGVSILQHDPEGKILFLHRNMPKWMTTRESVITHVQEYSRDADLLEFKITKEFKGRHKNLPVCFGKWDFGSEHMEDGRPSFYVYPLADYSLDHVEQLYLDYMELAIIQQKSTIQLLLELFGIVKCYRSC